MGNSRDDMLERLKGFADAEFEELVFHLQLSAIVLGKPASRTERAIELVRAMESRGEDAWLRLEKMVYDLGGPAAQPPISLGPEVLLVFIGHSPDADEEAKAFRELEEELNRELDNLQASANGALPFKVIQCRQRTYDASPNDSQEAAITPDLDRADIVLFVFKERVEPLAWRELERSRSRSDPAIPVIAFFAAKPPEGDRMSDLAVAESWADLLRKKQSFENLLASHPKSPTQVVSYTDVKQLKQLVTEQLKAAIEKMANPLPTRVGIPETIFVVKRFIGDNPDLSPDQRPVLAHSVEELDAVIVRRFLDRPLSREQLENAGLRAEDSNASIADRLNALGCLSDGRPTLGAFLCLAPSLLLMNKFDGCSLQMVTYSNPRKGPSSPSITKAQGNLLKLYEDGMSWLMKGAGLRRQGRVGSSERDELEIPEIVLREALANALVHRDYEADLLKNQPTRLEVFPDRVEVTSFGSPLVPVELLNKDTDSLVPWRRNPVIAKIFQHMSHVELNASGVPRMRLEMEKASLAFPKFIDNVNKSVVRVVLLRPSVGVEELKIVLPMSTPRRGQLRAMISSSAIDLPEHRKQAFDACLRLGFFPITFERFPTSDSVPVEASLGLVDEADLYIGIYAGRYGQIPEGKNSSITEIEFNRAVERGIPIFAFMMHEDHPVTRAMVEPGDVPQQRLAEFKARVRNCVVVNEFKSPEDLRDQIDQALAALNLQDERFHPSAVNPKWSDELRIYGEGFVGRQEELAALDRAWMEGVRIFALYAEGGAGKTRVVVEWLRRMRDNGWRGAQRVFVHSFYSQGSDESRNASSELFFEYALAYFGYRGEPITQADEKGRTLARLLLEHQGLLVLDGLEPLQHPTKHAEQGRLKDPGIARLLLSLANVPPGETRGLCLITSRQPVIELRERMGATVVQKSLDRLHRNDGAALLREFEVVGPDEELRKASDEFRGHAYSLMLLGSHLKSATNHHDIRRRREAVLLDEDPEHGNYARHMFAAYVRHLGEDSPEVAVLRLLGFFNRAAERQLLDVLRTRKGMMYEWSKGKEEFERSAQAKSVEDALSEMTAPLLDLAPPEWYRVLNRLRDLRLIDFAGPERSPVLDAHPLLRECFAEQVRTQFPAAWQAGHRRLFEHLSGTAPYWPEGLEGLQPLYRAVAHGCLAGLHKKACLDIYRDRILRGTGVDGFYSTRKLGAIGADLGAVACFFTTRWTTLATNLAPADQAWLLNEAAFRLRALGRLGEAVEPMRAVLEMLIRQGNWKEAAISASNLSELELTRGEMAAAVNTGEQSVMYADYSGDAFQQIARRATLADALHQGGCRDKSRRLFEDAESRQAAWQPEYPQLYSLWGFLYCDLLLADAENAAWQRWLGGETDQGEMSTIVTAACDAVSKRASQTLAWGEENRASLLTIALDHLILSRATLYKSQPEREHISAAVEGLRAAAVADYLVRGLLTRAWLRSLSGDEAGCRVDLDEAWEIAERGPMPLLEADIQLTRARLFRDRAALEEARRLIERHGYHRRDGELADALAAAARW